MIILIMMVYSPVTRPETLFRQLGEIAHNIQLYEVMADIDSSEVQQQLQLIQKVLPTMREFIKRLEDSEMQTTMLMNYRQLSMMIKKIDHKFNNLQQLIQEVSNPRAK